MNRREAIKNLSISLGVTIAMPTVLSIFNACDRKTGSWHSEFFNNDEKIIVENLINTILSVDKNSFGGQLNLVQFVDKIIAHTLTPTQKQLFRKGAIAFGEKFEDLHGKNIVKGDHQEYDKILALYLKLSKIEEKKVLEQLQISFANVPEEKKTTYLIYKFLINVRKLALIGYFTSKEIIENKLEYQFDNRYV
ncbi:gluconate 2-dehydrogenase subunit 3 family protein [Bacteroidota bacterium]